MLNPTYACKKRKNQFLFFFIFPLKQRGRLNPVVLVDIFVSNSCCLCAWIKFRLGNMEVNWCLKFRWWIMSILGVFCTKWYGIQCGYITSVLPFLYSRPHLTAFTEGGIHIILNRSFGSSGTWCLAFAMLMLDWNRFEIEIVMVLGRKFSSHSQSLCSS